MKLTIQNLTESIQQLANIISKQNSTFDWSSAISAACSLISLIAIFLLVKERMERKRPYLQVSFELLRSSLVCIVIRNVGEVPAKLTELTFNKDFVNQLPELGRKHTEDRKDLNIYIYPNQKWVLCLDIIAGEAINYKNTKLNISYKYSSKESKKSYFENETVNFNDYSNFLIYISDVDELANEVKKLGNNIEKINRTLDKIQKVQDHYTETQTYSTIGDRNQNTIVTGHRESNVIKKGNLLNE